MKDASVTRRRLLTGVGSAVVAGLAGCGAGTAETPPRQPASPTTDRPRPHPASPTRRHFDARSPACSWSVSAARRSTTTTGSCEAIRNGLGGVILFDRELATNAPRNITSPAQVTALMKTLRQASPGRLIVSIDQEGGQVARLNPSNGFPATKSRGRDRRAQNSPAATRAWASEHRQQPHVDRRQPQLRPGRRPQPEPEQPGDRQLGRSFSGRPRRRRRQRDRGDPGPPGRPASSTSLKHFPGLGTATGNTDFDVVDVSDTWTPGRTRTVPTADRQRQRRLGTWSPTSQQPTRPDRPASLSQAVVTDLLRGQLGWNGVRSSATTCRPPRSPGSTARTRRSRWRLEAGLDLLVFANQQVYDPNIVDETVDNVVDLVRDGHITEAQIDQSVARVDTLRPPR